MKNYTTDLFGAAQKFLILAQVEEKIWSLYGDDIIEMERCYCVHVSSQNPADADSLGDDFPF